MLWEPRMTNSILVQSKSFTKRYVIQSSGRIKDSRILETQSVVNEVFYQAGQAMVQLYRSFEEGVHK